VTCPACERPHRYGGCVAWYFVYVALKVILTRSRRAAGFMRST